MAEAAIAAGACIVNDVSGLRDPALADVCAATGAALVLMHTRAAPKQRLQDPALYDDVFADVARSSRERMEVARDARRARRADPARSRARTSPRRPRRRSPCCAASSELHALGRPLLLAVSRKDFVGALTGRGPRERLAGTLAAIGYGVDAGAHVLRVHDVAQAADFLRGARGAARRAGGRSGARAGRRASGTRADRVPEVYESPAAVQRGRAPTDESTGEPMSVISRSALESSSLADLHEIASELGLDGYRRLRKADLVGAIIERQGGDDGGARPTPTRRRDDVAADADGRADDAGKDDATTGPRAARAAAAAAARGRATATRATSSEDDADADPQAEATAPRRRAPRARRRAPRENGGARDRDRGGDRDRGTAIATATAGAPPTIATRAAPSSCLPNGSGFLRVSPPEPSDDDVYISAAQVRRCELVSGDEVTGPVRAPRRSERYPSLIRVDTINGRSADEVSEGTKYDDLPCTLRDRAHRARRRRPDAQGDRVAHAVRPRLARRHRRRPARRQDRGAAPPRGRARGPARTSSARSCSPACAPRRSRTTSRARCSRCPS